MLLLGSLGAVVYLWVYLATHTVPDPKHSQDVVSPGPVLVKDRWDFRANTGQASYQRGPDLEVLSRRCEKEYSYVFVRGEVRNLSGQKLENVMVVGEFRTSDGRIVKTSDALLDYNPIMPGQTSPFSAGTTDNPEIKRCNISFRYLFGTSLNFTTREIRQQDGREHIAEAQRLLKAHGYDPGPADGIRGARTEAAVQAFQKDRNLAVDGRINETLLRELRK
jgi:hypothetical protein